MVALSPGPGDEANKYDNKLLSQLLLLNFNNEIIMQ